MHVDAAVETARRAAQPVRATFTIGFQTGQEPKWLARRWALHDQLTNIEVVVCSDYSPHLAEALTRGRMDVAFMRASRAIR